MTSEEIISLSALELGKAIKEGRTSAVEACHAYISAIDEKDGEYNSFITVLRQEALLRAAALKTFMTGYRRQCPARRRRRRKHPG